MKNVGCLVEFIDLFGDKPTIGIVMFHSFSDEWGDELYSIIAEGNHYKIPGRSIIKIYNKM